MASSCPSERAKIQGLALRQLLGIDGQHPLRCPKCGGLRHRVITITDPFVARKTLRRSRPFAPSRRCDSRGSSPPSAPAETDAPPTGRRLLVAAWLGGVRPKQGALSPQHPQVRSLRLDLRRGGVNSPSLSRAAPVTPASPSLQGPAATSTGLLKSLCAGRLPAPGKLLTNFQSRCASDRRFCFAKPPTVGSLPTWDWKF